MEFLTHFLPLDTATLTTFLMLSPAARLLALLAVAVGVIYLLFITELLPSGDRFSPCDIFADWEVVYVVWCGVAYLPKRQPQE